MKDEDARFEELLAAIARAPATTPEAPDQSLLGRAVGPYKASAIAGRGATGVVLRAEDPRLGRTVALKILGAEHQHDPALRDLFAREAKSSAAQSHPGIAAIFDVGSFDGRPYIAMEWASGGTLRERLGAGPIPPQDVRRFLREIAEALAHAHRGGFVHLDLKPENVALDAEGRIKLLDFGLAQLTRAPTSLTAGGGGTRGYMAPEQTARGHVDARADVYAFGVMGYELATGVRGARRLPRELRDLDELLRRACSAEPAARPADGDALLSALRRTERATRVRGTTLARWLPVLAAVLISVVVRTTSRTAPPAARPLTSASSEVLIRSLVLSESGETLYYLEPRGVFRRPIDGDGLEQVSIPAELSALSLTHASRDGALEFVGVGPAGPGEYRVRSDGSTEPVARAPILASEGALLVAGARSPSARRTAWIEVVSTDRGRDVKLLLLEAGADQPTLISTDRRLLGSLGLGGVAFRDEDRLYALLEGRGVIALGEWRIDGRGPPIGPKIAGELPGGAAQALSVADKRAVVLAVRNEADVFALDLEPSTRRARGVRKLSFTEKNELPASIAGRREAWTMVESSDGGSSRSLLELLPFDGGAPRILGAPTAWRTWPIETDEALLFFRIDEDRPRLVRASLDRSRLKLGPETVLAELPPQRDVAGARRPPPFSHALRCAPAVSRCVLLERHPEHVELRSFAPTGTPDEDARPRRAQLSARDYGFDLDAKAETLAIASSEGLARVDVASGRVVDVYSRPDCSIQFVAWAPSGQALYYSGVCANDKYQVRRRELGRAATDEVVFERDDAWITGVFVAPDESALIVGVMPFHGNAWLIDLD